MKSFRPIHFVVFALLLLVCFAGWKMYEAGNRWNEQAAVPKPQGYLVISVAPIEDHTFKPPRTNFLSVQIDGPQTGTVTVKLRDPVTNKIVLQKDYAYKGDGLEDKISVMQLPAGRYLWYAYLNTETRSAGTLELK